ncbi:unnamed protein product, partial [Pylaiella littoralis]
CCAAVPLRQETGGQHTSRNRSIAHDVWNLGEALEHTSGGTPMATLTGRRESGRRTSSRHFVDAARTPPRQRLSGSEPRSEYFKSSPDSCAGSAISFDWGS